MYFNETCKSCKKEFKVEDSDYYGEEDNDYFLMIERELCYPCLINAEQTEQIEDMTYLLNSLNEEQRELFARVLENIYSPRNLMQDLITSHFQGYEGIRSWGLW